MSVLRIPTARVYEPLLPPARDKVARGGRGGGKSRFFAGLLIEDALAYPSENGGEGLRAICIRQVQRDLAQSSKMLLENVLREYALDSGCGFRVYRDAIATPNDGLIIFKGMNDMTADSIKSLEGLHRGWWDEAQAATQHSIDLYRPTMRAKGSQMWWSYNPRRPTDPVDKMFMGEEKPEGAVVVTANWDSNPWVNDELNGERLDCLRMNPEQYGHVWGGEYIGVASGSYFSRQLVEAKNEGRISRVAFDPLFRVRLFFDIGGTGARADACSIWPAQFIGREMRFRDYYETQGQPLSAHVNWLRSNGYGPDRADIYLPHDGATQDKVYAVSYESALREAGYDVTVVPNQGKGAANMRIEAVRRMFPTMWFDEASTEAGREALGFYHERRDAKRDMGLGPEHDWSSHAADAFGLACVAYEAPRQKRKMNYGSFGIA